MSGENRKLGLIGATSAYLVWGFLPIFWENVRQSRRLGSRCPSRRLVIACDAPTTGDFQKFHKFKKTFHYFAEQKQYAICLTLAAAFAGVNWWINIYGVNSNQVVELGIGMFLTPPISVFLEFFFYKEKLPPLKWASILLAFLGLLIMVFQLGRIPWIAVGVSSTWAIYGALKKKIKVDPWISNTIESGLMLPLALVYIFTLNHVGTSHFSPEIRLKILTWVLVSTGVITTIPMVAFSYAALNLPLNVPGSACISIRYLLC